MQAHWSGVSSFAEAAWPPGVTSCSRETQGASCRESPDNQGHTRTKMVHRLGPSRNMIPVEPDLSTQTEEVGWRQTS